MNRAQMSRRSLIAAAGALAGAAALPTLGHVAQAADTITLNVYVHDNHPFDKVKPLFEAKYPNVKLNMMKQNDVAAFRATLAANGDGTPDIFWPEIDMVQDLGKSQVLLDVTDIITAQKSDLAAGATAECFIQSTKKYAAFPGSISPVGFFYRQDLLDKAGVAIPADWTWDEFATVAKTIKAKTGANSLVIPSTGTSDTALLWSYVLNQMGGSITNADGSLVTLDDDKGIAAMQQTKRLFAADVATDEVATAENYFAEISAGHVAMTPQAVWYRGFGIEPNVTDETSGLGQWRVALLPNAGPGTARTANYGGAATASTMYTKHPAEVKDFMSFAFGTMEGSEACGDWGILPPFLPYLNSPKWSAVRSAAFGDFAFNDVWTQAVGIYPATWHKQPVFSEAMTAVGAAMMPILQGSVDVTAGLKAIGEQVRQLNTRYQ